ncbi:MAG: hypothetical protein GYB68_03390 [Chloroflexi bacterium]|nr:hypothetical protein [Chloroflexota bacterium]
MPLPDLQPWTPTAQALHLASRTIGVARLLSFDHRPNYLELPMHVMPWGLSSGELPGGGRLNLDFVNQELIYRHDSAATRSFKLADHSQKSLMTAFLNATKDYEYGLALKDSAEADLIDKALELTQAKEGSLPPTPEEISSEEPLRTDPAVAAGFAEVLYAVFTGIARFRARLVGPQTPIVVWPEHFDLSGLWFPTSSALETDPHLNFGFAPFSPGIPRPYIYVYAWPYLDEYDVPMMPSPAQWETTDYTGAIVHYDDFKDMAYPEQIVEDLCLRIYNAILPVLKLG